MLVKYLAIAIKKGRGLIIYTLNTTTVALPPTHYYSLNILQYQALVLRHESSYNVDNVFIV